MPARGDDMMANIDFLVPGGALAGSLAERLLHGDKREAPPLLAGAQVGAFRIVELLGSGGSSWVYRAERADRSFEQHVAIKLLRGDRQLDSVMQRERRILAGLRHPHIAMIVDGGNTDEGRPWFAMELVDGERIDSHCRQRGLDWRRRLGLMRQVVLAVAHAHRHMVVHCDIKPANVLVDESGHAKLLDFGIAGSALTREGESSYYAFTPEFASPEQRSGEPVTAASDIYQCGNLLDVLLFDHEDPAHTKTPMPAWTRRDIEAIVARATAHEPGQRYANALQMADDIARVGRDRPLLARDQERGYRARMVWRRHGIAITAGIALVISLIAGTAIALWQARVATEHARVAEQQAEHARRTKDFVVGILQAGNPEQAIGAARTVEDLLRSTDARIDTELADLPLARAEMHVAIGSSLIALGQTEQGLSSLEQGVELLRGAGDGGQRELAAALHTLASRYAVINRLDEALAASIEAEKLYSRIDGALSVDRLSVLAVQARIAGLRNRYDEELALYRHILDVRRQLLGPDDSRLAMDLNNLAATALLCDLYDEAEQAYREALRVIVLPPTAPESRQTWLYAGLGAVYSNAWRLDEAEQALASAREIGERTLYPEHRILASVDVALSRVRMLQGRHAEAVELARRGVAIFAADQHIELHTAELQLGLALLDQGDFAAALPVLEDAVSHGLAVRGQPDPLIRLAQAGVALAQLHLGDIDAIVELQRQVTFFEQSPGLSRRFYAQVLDLMANAQAFLGDASGERSHREREVAVYVALLGPQAPRVHALRAALR